MIELMKDPRAKIALVVAGVALVIYLLTGSWLNYIQTTDKTIQSNWLSLKQNYERRVQLVPKFVQLIQYFSPQALELQQELSKTYESVTQAPLTDKILTDQALMQDVMVRQIGLANALAFMEMQVKQYPAVAQNREFLMLNMELLALDQQIEYTSALLNQNVMIYNSFLTGFPKNWLNVMFLKEKEKQVLPIATMRRVLERSVQGKTPPDEGTGIVDKKH
ncbi:MAG: LemA family protein [Proteobacteria bacterium]|nr:LemA family protein [Pseudomonadota bacterium]